MRLLFLSTVYPHAAAPTRGIYNRLLVEALAEEHEVCVVAPVPWRQAARAWRRVGGVHLGGSTVHVDRPVFAYPPGLAYGLHGTFLWLSSRATVRRLYRHFIPDAVISYWAHPDGEAAGRAAALANAPLALIVGGSDILLLAQNKRRRRTITRVLDSASAVLAVGEDLRDRVLELGVPASRVHVYRRGVSDIFSPGDRFEARRAVGLAESDRLLLWVGNFLPVKAVDVLLDACDILVGLGVEFNLCLVGEGPLRRQTERRVSSSALADRVRFVGRLAQDELPNWYRSADVTVLPSLSEGTPNVLLESLACGTPFVASRVGGVAGLASDSNGDLVPPGDPVSLAAALRARLERPGRPPQQLGEAFRWADSGALVSRVIQGLLPVPP